MQLSGPSLRSQFSQKGEMSTLGIPLKSARVLHKTQPKRLYIVTQINGLCGMAIKTSHQRWNNYHIFGLLAKFFIHKSH